MGKTLEDTRGISFAHVGTEGREHTPPSDCESEVCHLHWVSLRDISNTLFLQPDSNVFPQATQRSSPKKDDLVRTAQSP